jgi:hypothetical protein
MYAEAFKYGSEAVKINPNDPRLATNLSYYSAASSS